MKKEYGIALFAVLVGSIFFYKWYVSNPSSQVGGALYGIPGTDPISPFMGALLLIWFMLVGFIVFLNKPKP